MLFGSLLPVLFFLFFLYHVLRTYRNLIGIECNTTVQCASIGSENGNGYEFIFISHSFERTVRNTDTRIITLYVNRQLQQIQNISNTNPVYRPICIAVTPCVIAFRGQHWNYRFNQISCSIHLSLGVYFLLLFFLSHFELLFNWQTNKTNTNIYREEKTELTWCKKTNEKCKWDNLRLLFGQSIQLTKCIERH